MTIAASPKDPDQNKTYRINVLEQLVPEALRSTEYEVDDVVRATRDSGFYLKCTTGGRTGRYNPYSPRQASQVISDGSVQWTSQHPDDVSVAHISAVVWSVDPSGELSVASQSESGHDAEVTLAGGVDGCDYEVTASITPDSGDPFDMTLVVPVSHQ